MTRTCAGTALLGTCASEKPAHYRTATLTLLCLVFGPGQAALHQFSSWAPCAAAPSGLEPLARFPFGFNPERRQVGSSWFPAFR